VRAVDDAETVTPGNWAPAGRPVRPLAGVEVKVMTADRAARADRRTRWNAMKPRIQCVQQASGSEPARHSRLTVWYGRCRSYGHWCLGFADGRAVAQRVDAAGQRAQAEGYGAEAE